MNQENLLASIKAKHIHLVGIKGTGMAALTEILLSRGAIISGSDVEDVFYTDRILKELGINFNTGFSPKNITNKTELVIYSSAYAVDSHCELKKARQRGIPLISYTQALGELSRLQESSAISGVHGKTTTTAMTGTILKALELPCTILTAGEVINFGNRSTLVLGDKYFIAETCEYRRHFLHYRPRRIVITSVELDHPDYFPNQADVEAAFIEFASLLPYQGQIIYHCDDPGVKRVVRKISKIRKDIEFIAYGKTAQGWYKVQKIVCRQEETAFCLAGFKREFLLKIPSQHSVYNAVAAMALCFEILKSEGKNIEENQLNLVKKALIEFKGSRRRCEIVGRTAGILFMDDYAHHPTAIYKTLKGLREFYPARRIVVDFMSHTYSRTKALFKEFGRCFEPAHEVILHKIYASAREKNNQGVTGKHLYNKVGQYHKQVKYFNEIMQAKSYLLKRLKPGDLFITMGAGDNWKLGIELYYTLKGE